MESEEADFWGRVRIPGRLSRLFRPPQRVDHSAVLWLSTGLIYAGLAASAVARELRAFGAFGILYGLHLIYWRARWAARMEKRWFNPFQVRLPPWFIGCGFIAIGTLIVVTN